MQNGLDCILITVTISVYLIHNHIIVSINIQTLLKRVAVVHQYYQSEVNNEYVIRGNSAILKCSIPSFVSEFVQVVGWQDDQGNSFNPNEENGIYFVL